MPQSVMTPKVDCFNGVAAIIDFEHYMVHAGNAFTVAYSSTTAATDDHRTGIGWEVPAAAEDRRIHFAVTVETDQAAEAFILEGPAMVDYATGETKPVVNRLRESAIQSIITDPASASAHAVETYLEAELAAGTFLGVGTELAHHLLGGGNGPFAIGGVSRGQQEFVCRPAYKYLVYLQNIGANVTTHNITLSWYDLADGDYAN